MKPNRVFRAVRLYENDAAPAASEGAVKPVRSVFRGVDCRFFYRLNTSLATYAMRLLFRRFYFKTASPLHTVFGLRFCRF